MNKFCQGCSKPFSDIVTVKEAKCGGFCKDCLNSKTSATCTGSDYGCTCKNCTDYKISKQSHYPVDFMQFIEEAVKSLSGIEAFYAANILKYVARFDKKDGLNDLMKAEDYLKRLIKINERDK